ncbi:MAG: bacteriophage holin [Verrucomicrobia bacterium]|nr:bacteriophage holin [Verrucomicrobiota bacterium]
MLKAKELGIAGGIIWGLCMFVTTILSMYTGYAKEFLNIMGGIYPGYTISGFGSLLGLVYGFFDAGIGFFLLAWLYNKLTKTKRK